MVVMIIVIMIINPERPRNFDNNNRFDNRNRNFNQADRLIILISREIEILEITLAEIKMINLRA